MYFITQFCFVLEMSKGDIERLNRLYQCKKNATDIEKKVAPKNNTFLKSEKEQINNMISKDGNDEEMILTKEQIDFLFSTNAAKRNGLKSAFHHWPNAIVPFEIDSSFKPKFLATILESMTYISNRTCVRFKRLEI